MLAQQDFSASGPQPGRAEIWMTRSLTLSPRVSGRLPGRKYGARGFREPNFKRLVLNECSIVSELFGGYERWDFKFLLVLSELIYFWKFACLV